MQLRAIDPVTGTSCPRAVILGPSRNLTPHFHDSVELGYCFSGTGVIVVGQKLSQFTVGDVVLIWPGQLHIAWTLEGEAHWKFINFDPALLPIATDPRLSPSPTSAFMEASALQHVIPANQEPEISALVRSIVRELDIRLPGYADVVKNSMQNLMIWIRRRFPPSRQIPGKTRKLRDAIRSLEPALAQIAGNHPIQIGVPDLAKACGMSESTLRRTFIRAFGQSPLKYLTAFRVSTATVLLRSTEQTIIEIAGRVGFPTLSSFNRHFLKEMKMSPRIYRKNCPPTYPPALLKKPHREKAVSYFSVAQEQTE